MGDTFVMTGLREKRSALAGQIVELRRQLDQLQADIFHLDMVLRLYGEQPQDIVRSLLNLKVGDRISAHREAIVLSYIALSGFSDDGENASRCNAALALYQRDDRFLWRRIFIGAVLRLAADIGFVGFNKLAFPAPTARQLAFPRCF